MKFRVVLGMRHEHADPPFPFGLLPARRERPRRCRSAEKRDEVTALHVRPRIRTRYRSGQTSTLERVGGLGHSLLGRLATSSDVRFEIRRASLNGRDVARKCRAAAEIAAIVAEAKISQSLFFDVAQLPAAHVRLSM
jgi:hypothetical protein